MFKQQNVPQNLRCSWNHPYQVRNCYCNHSWLYLPILLVFASENTLVDRNDLKSFSTLVDAAFLLTVTTQTLLPEVHDNIMSANNAPSGLLLGYTVEDAFLAPLFKILWKSTSWMSCKNESFAPGRENHGCLLYAASVIFTSTPLPESTPPLWCTNSDFPSPRPGMLRSSFQAKVEKLKDSSDIHNGPAKPCVGKGEIDLPARSVHATAAHSAPVKDMTALVHDDTVILEGRLHHLEE